MRAFDGRFIGRLPRTSRRRGPTPDPSGKQGVRPDPDLAEVAVDRVAELQPVGVDDPIVVDAPDLCRPKRRGPTAKAELAPTGGAEVAHPMRLAASRDEVTMALEIEWLAHRDRQQPPLRRPWTIRAGKPRRWLRIGLATWVMRKPGRM